MLEAHAPHGAVHTWTDFFIHIATIVIGLVIAVGLEQTVEFFHHRHQRLQLDEQMRGVLEKDLQLVATDTNDLNSFRSFLFDLQDAVSARAGGQSTPAQPGPYDRRSVTNVGTPGLAPYEAAQENGTIALLPSGEIRLYNRIAYQVSLLRTALDHWRDSLEAANSFARRFNHSPDDFPLFEIDHVPLLDALSPAELIEYRALVGTMITATETVMERMRIITVECRAILDGAHEEDDLIKAVTAMLNSGTALRNSNSPGKQ
jgi:hypothetical protein